MDELLGLLSDLQRATAEETDRLLSATTEQEAEILFDSNLTLQGKLAKLTALRGETATKPKSFRKRLTKADTFHARALGIRL